LLFALNQIKVEAIFPLRASHEAFTNQAVAKDGDIRKSAACNGISLQVAPWTKLRSRTGGFGDLAFKVQLATEHGLSYPTQGSLRPQVDEECSFFVDQKTSVA
jgi:hypothetical protein